ncbi:superoxide dismutase family protein [Trinickia caryophylli]|nr:superoxide dismutase family protein [Trinickia caryophylli]PMS10144.1 superoxide dismutase family protein [Trinickia caryophylli]TRX18244.1 superoxide dismutase family protein [Trinickia caryophylli]WQE10969.1 superoxide dismutase family protein [Trinickia caryophylli]GLU35420.1 membrane-attached superoxide dismutase [Trinickia caryophylli]
MRERTDGRCLQALGVLACVGLVGLTGATLGGCAAFLGPHEKRATAQLLPTVANTARGSVTFIERSDGVQVTYNLIGLPPMSDHALQVHERGDCNAADGSSAGAVFAPGASRRRGGGRLEGDLGNIHADATGVATGFIVAPDVSLDGVRSVAGRSVVIHREPGDPAFPDHGVGAALACGTIRAQ